MQGCQYRGLNMPAKVPCPTCSPTSVARDLQNFRNTWGRRSDILFLQHFLNIIISSDILYMWTMPSQWILLTALIFAVYLYLIKAITNAKCYVFLGDKKHTAQGWSPYNLHYWFTRMTAVIMWYLHHTYTGDFMAHHKAMKNLIHDKFCNITIHVFELLKTCLVFINQVYAAYDVLQ